VIFSVDMVAGRGRGRCRAVRTCADLCGGHLYDDCAGWRSGVGGVLAGWRVDGALISSCALVWVAALF